MTIKAYPVHFDTSSPTVTEMRERYGSNVIDLSAYRGLTHADVADAVLSPRRNGRKCCVAIPCESGVYDFWDHDSAVRVQGRDVPLDSALRMMKFGDEVNLNHQGTPLSEYKEKEMTPRKLFLEVLGAEKNMKKMLEGSVRGIGWWDPRSRKHRLLSPDVIVEGQKFAEFYERQMDFRYQRADVYATVPSLDSGREDGHEVGVRVLPVTDADDAFLYEWAMTSPSCGCLDSFFRSISGKYMDDEFVDVHKYARPEEHFCRHSWGVVIGAQRRSGRQDSPEFMVKFPEATGLIAPWHTLGSSTVVKTGNRYRRPTRTEARVQLGRAMGYAGPEVMLDLAE